MDVEEAGEIGKLENTIKTVSFFGEKRLMVVKNFFGEADKTLEIIKNWDLVNDKQNILILTENKSESELAKTNKKIFTLLTNKPNISKSFEPLSGKQLESWVVKEVKSLNTKIDSQGLKKLIDYTVPPSQGYGEAKSDSWRIAQEIEKLANYSQGKTIDEKAVELLITPIVNLNIFETIDALGSKNKAKALISLAKHLENGDDPYYLFSMFVYQFRNLLRIKSLLVKYITNESIAKKTNLHPFVIRKMSAQARKFELEELKQKFSNLAQSDIAVKNGHLDIVDCLYQTVLN